MATLLPQENDSQNLQSEQKQESTVVQPIEQKHEPSNEEQHEPSNEEESEPSDEEKSEQTQELTDAQPEKQDHVCMCETCVNIRNKAIESQHQTTISQNAQPADSTINKVDMSHKNVVKNKETVDEPDTLYNQDNKTTRNILLGLGIASAAFVIGGIFFSKYRSTNK